MAYVLGLISLLASAIALIAVTAFGASEISAIGLAIFYVIAFYALARVCQGHEANKLQKQILKALELAPPK